MKEQQQNRSAMESYRSVTSGNQYIPAQIRYALLLSKNGKINEALQYLKRLPATNDQQRAQLIIAEAQLLRESGDYQKAFRILEQRAGKISRLHRSFCTTMRCRRKKSENRHHGAAICVS